MNVEQLRKMAAEAGFELIMKHKDGSTTVLPDALFKNFAALVLAEHRSQGEVAAHGEADRLLDEYMAACARSDVEARDQARAAVRAAFARASVTPEGDAEAWMHEDDPARVISAIQKSQAEKDGGASASSVKAYSIRLNKHQSKAQGATAEDWVSAIAPLMPADFKDWHQNNPNEWPRVTAEVIRALRESEAFWIEQAGKPKAHPKNTVPQGLTEDVREFLYRVQAFVPFDQAAWFQQRSEAINAALRAAQSPAAANQPTNVEDAANGNMNAIRHVAYAEGYLDGKASQAPAVMAEHANRYEHLRQHGFGMALMHERPEDLDAAVDEHRRKVASQPPVKAAGEQA